MTSKSSPPPWDFAPIYNLLDAFNHPPPPNDQVSDDGAESVLPVSDPSDIITESRKPSNLGDFHEVFLLLGQTVDEQHPRHESTGSSSAAGSNYSTPPSSIPNEAIHLNDRVKEVRWTDQVDGTDLAGFESEPVPSRDRSHSVRRLKRRQGPLDVSEDESTPLSPAKGNSTSLTPSWAPRPKSDGVLWVPPSTPKIDVDPLIIKPIHPRTADEKKAELMRKLKARFEVASDSLGNNDPNGIHVFVDCSNIIIGFYNVLKLKRGYNVRAYITKAPIIWPSLALILERGRTAARRILVGSNGSPPDGRPPRFPNYMLEAEKCGYELNILERVLKHKDPTPPKKKKSKGTGNGYATTSGHSSGSEGTFLGTKVVAEQGVDEILQMKLLESLVDTHKPSTIVLASGDAAEAEYSGGFMKNVLRALTKGWKVELVAWSTGLSHEYLSKEFLRRWKGKFELVLLDDFSEELLAL